MELHEFQKIRTNIISDLLDNPDKNGIYPTTAIYEKLDNLYRQVQQEAYTAGREIEGQRLMIASLAMNGILASKQYSEPIHVAERAVKMTDALLKEVRATEKRSN